MRRGFQLSYRLWPQVHVRTWLQSGPHDKRRQWRLLVPGERWGTGLWVTPKIADHKSHPHMAGDKRDAGFTRLYDAS
ncbi:hypothetical protein CUJ84_Chr000088 [Rhizobium leguminosarum]|uniref:Uncharacterized protein n=1 Tax=Rhizobium leguminosarum TaxID=384 RepID=A0A2K9YXB7_RHILE|nr:hypothetical protein CUJ84_Chr000088 [Rhizobium leguminosarum]